MQTNDRQRRFRIYAANVSSLCSAVAVALGKSQVVLTVSFVGARAMRALNRNYRGRDHTTDVLSFAYADEVVDGMTFLGEIVICPNIAWEQARRWGATPQREVRRLLIHGILHLLGHDHETDDGEMRLLERRILRRRFAAEAGPLLQLKR